MALAIQGSNKKTGSYCLGNNKIKWKSIKESKDGNQV